MANEKKNLAWEKPKENITKKKLVETTTTTTMARHPLCLLLSSTAPCYDSSLLLSLSPALTCLALLLCCCSLWVSLQPELSSAASVDVDRNTIEGNVWQIKQQTQTQKKEYKAACKRNCAKFKAPTCFWVLSLSPSVCDSDKCKVHKQIGK